MSSRLSEVLRVLAKSPSNLAQLQKPRGIKFNFRDIGEIDFVGDFYADIIELSLNHNNLKSLDGIEQFESLQILSINFNQLESVDELAKIRSPHLVRELNCRGNPGWLFEGDQGEFLVQLILAFFPNLVKLNGNLVRDDKQEFQIDQNRSTSTTILPNETRETEESQKKDPCKIRENQQKDTAKSGQTRQRTQKNQHQIEQKNEQQIVVPGKATQNTITAQLVTESTLENHCKEQENQRIYSEQMTTDASGPLTNVRQMQEIPVNQPYANHMILLPPADISHISTVADQNKQFSEGAADISLVWSTSGAATGQDQRNVQKIPQLKLTESDLHEAQEREFERRKHITSFNGKDEEDSEDIDTMRVVPQNQRSIERGENEDWGASQMNTHGRRFQTEESQENAKIHQNVTNQVLAPSSSQLLQNETKNLRNQLGFDQSEISQSKRSQMQMVSAALSSQRALTTPQRQFESQERRDSQRVLTCNTQMSGSVQQQQYPAAFIENDYNDSTLGRNNGGEQLSLLGGENSRYDSHNMQKYLKPSEIYSTQRTMGQYGTPPVGEQMQNQYKQSDSDLKDNQIQVFQIERKQIKTDESKSEFSKYQTDDSDIEEVLDGEQDIYGQTLDIGEQLSMLRNKKRLTVEFKVFFAWRDQAQKQRLTSNNVEFKGRRDLAMDKIWSASRELPSDNEESHEALQPSNTDQRGTKQVSSGNIQHFARQFAAGLSQSVTSGGQHYTSAELCDPQILSKKPQQVKNQILPSGGILQKQVLPRQRNPLPPNRDLLSLNSERAGQTQAQTTNRTYLEGYSLRQEELVQGEINQQFAALDIRKDKKRAKNQPYKPSQKQKQQNFQSNRIQQDGNFLDQQSADVEMGTLGDSYEEEEEQAQDFYEQQDQDGENDDSYQHGSDHESEEFSQSNQSETNSSDRRSLQTTSDSNYETNNSDEEESEYQYSIQTSKYFTKRQLAKLKRIVTNFLIFRLKSKTQIFFQKWKQVLGRSTKIGSKRSFQVRSNSQSDSQNVIQNIKNNHLGVGIDQSLSMIHPTSHTNGNNSTMMLNSVENSYYMRSFAADQRQIYNHQGQQPGIPPLYKKNVPHNNEGQAFQDDHLPISTQYSEQENPKVQSAAFAPESLEIFDNSAVQTQTQGLLTGTNSFRENTNVVRFSSQGLQSDESTNLNQSGVQQQYQMPRKRVAFAIQSLSPTRKEVKNMLLQKNAPFLKSVLQQWSIYTQSMQLKRLRRKEKKIIRALKETQGIDLANKVSSKAKKRRVIEIKEDKKRRKKGESKTKLVQKPATNQENRQYISNQAQSRNQSKKPPKKTSGKSQPKSVRLANDGGKPPKRLTPHISVGDKTMQTQTQPSKRLYSANSQTSQISHNKKIAQQFASFQATQSSNYQRNAFHRASPQIQSSQPFGTSPLNQYRMPLSQRSQQHFGKDTVSAFSTGHLQTNEKHDNKGASAVAQQTRRTTGIKSAVKPPLATVVSSAQQSKRSNRSTLLGAVTNGQQNLSKEVFIQNGVLVPRKQSSASASVSASVVGVHQNYNQQREQHNTRSNLLIHRAHDRELIQPDTNFVGSTTNHQIVASSQSNSQNRNPLNRIRHKSRRSSSQGGRMVNNGENGGNQITQKGQQNNLQADRKQQKEINLAGPTKSLKQIMSSVAWGGGLNKRTSHI